jgi:hypothetical protein
MLLNNGEMQKRVRRMPKLRERLDPGHFQATKVDAARVAYR